LFFGRSGHNRFDCKDHFGVCYASADELGAFVESFIHSTGVRFVELERLRKRGVARLLTLRPLQLVRLYGAGLAKLGVDARIATGDYAIAQQWSRAFHEHRQRPDGLMYPSRHDTNRLCVALFERISGELRSEQLGAWTDQPKLLTRIVDAYELALI
jgi:hypothetical protein